MPDHCDSTPTRHSSLYRKASAVYYRSHCNFFLLFVGGSGGGGGVGWGRGLKLHGLGGLDESELLGNVMLLG